MNRPVGPQDPLVRLANAEKSISNLTTNIRNLLNENAKLKQRVYTLEVECGLRLEGESEDMDGEEG